ncbi:MAG: signal peptidase I [Acidobacteria bacterium]|nr:signal peptidase I [Acidobacteriota bacterium]
MSPAEDAGPAATSEGPGRSGSGRARRRSRLEGTFGPTGATIIEWVGVIAIAIGLALVVKVFLLQAFYIPSPSMYPTLKNGDRVLVNKLSYKLHDVNRGDIVVFERPASEADSMIPDLIKRVIGLPGDAVAFSDGHVFINGNQLAEPYLPAGVTTTSEFAPNHCTLEAPCVVPRGDVWVMGDNRSDSKDSRYFGPIPESSIVGRAFVVVWPLSRLSGL